MKLTPKFIVSFLIFTIFLGACSADPAESSPENNTVDVQATAESIVATLAAQTTQEAPTETPIPTPTEIPFFLTATIWTEEPRVPIVNFHEFAPDYAERSTDHKVRFEDFWSYMEQLNQAGYTLISVEEWINGNLHVPEGRRPLVFTMDDLFFNNQIRLDENGEPRLDTGLGISWKFYQEHPEFGFQWALFALLGDKYYGDGDPEFKWEHELGLTIAWCMDHGAKVYNHTYQHITLNSSDAAGITHQLEMHDLYLRELLTLAEREDIIPELGNMFAVPYGLWPEDRKVLYRYTTPEGLPMQAVYNIDFLPRAGFMAPPYSPEFDTYDIPRIAMPPDAVAYLVENKDAFPAATSCQVGPLDEEQAGDPGYLADAINASITSGACPTGVYVLEGQLFDARPGIVPQLMPQG